MADHPEAVRFEVTLSQAYYDALLRAASDNSTGAEDFVQFMLVDWLTEHGYLEKPQMPLSPEK